MRFHSLDVLRGITVVLMIIVNSPGNYDTTFAPLLHAEWHGFTPTDWVFPTFLFVVGNAMCFSLPKYMLLGQKAFLAKVVKRTCLIFLLGFLMYWFPFFQEINGQWVAKPLSEARIFGVLQRIALCYFFASLILFYGKEKAAFIFSVVALAGYWVVVSVFGDLTLRGNAVLRLDLLLFGAAHLYMGEGVPFDPEGLLSTFPAIVNVLAGYAAGNYIKEKGVHYEAIAKLLMVGLALVAAGLVWNWFFPINKKLWTSSFVVYTVGLDLLILPLLLFVIEIKKIQRWTYFFDVFGKNTLFIYLLSEVGLSVLWLISMDSKPLYHYLFANVLAPLAGNYLGSFLFALVWMLFCWCVGYILDKKQIYIKV